MNSSQEYLYKETGWTEFQPFWKVRDLSISAIHIAVNEVAYLEFSFIVIPPKKLLGSLEPREIN